MELTIGDIFGFTAQAFMTIAFVLGVAGLCMIYVWPKRTWCLTFGDLLACVRMKFGIVECVYGVVFALTMASVAACAAFGGLSYFAG